MKLDSLPFAPLLDRVRAVAARPGVKRALKIAQWALLALIVVLLVSRLSEIGWRDVFASMPTSPWFFIFFALRYLTLPAAEVAVYQIIWNRPLIAHFQAFIRKRVYNMAVAGYSGEGFLALWARRRLGLSDRDALVGIKDNNILSSFTANIATLSMVALLFAGSAAASFALVPGGGALVLFSSAAAAAMALTVIVFWRRIVSLPPRKSAQVLSIHATRQVVSVLFAAAMYAAAIPGAPFTAWLVFITLQLVISRIPFLPTQDLAYLAAALSLAPVVGAPEKAVAGMLVAEAGLLQLVHVALFLATAHLAGPSRRAPKSDGTA